MNKRNKIRDLAGALLKIKSNGSTLLGHKSIKITTLNYMATTKLRRSLLQKAVVEIENPGRDLRSQPEIEATK